MLNAKPMGLFTNQRSSRLSFIRPTLNGRKTWTLKADGFFSFQPPILPASQVFYFTARCATAMPLVKRR